jgi:hypothetical protein
VQSFITPHPLPPRSLPRHPQFSNLDSVLLQTGAQVAFVAADKKGQESQAEVGDHRKLVHLLERRSEWRRGWLRGGLKGGGFVNLLV